MSFDLINKDLTSIRQKIGIVTNVTTDSLEEVLTKLNNITNTFNIELEARDKIIEESGITIGDLESELERTRVKVIVSEERIKELKDKYEPKSYEVIESEEQETS